LLQKAYVGLIVIAALSAALIGCSGKPSTGLAHGEELYRTCKPCHGDAGHGNLDLRAPAIAGLPDWYIVEQLTKFKGDIRGAHPDDMEGHRMRPMARTLYRQGDIEAVAEYVSKMPSQWMPPTYAVGDTAAGAATFNGVCTTCHGPMPRATRTCTRRRSRSSPTGT